MNDDEDEIAEWTVWEYWNDDPDPPQRPMTDEQIDKWLDNLGKRMGWTEPTRYRP